MWLRGGYEEELGIMQDMKNKINKLRKSVTDMEEERNNLKLSYHNTREQVVFAVLKTLSISESSTPKCSGSKC